MRRWWWVNAALLAVPFAFAPHFFASFYAKPQIAIALADASAGLWTFSAALGEEHGKPIVLLRIADGAFADIQSANVVIRSPDGGEMQRRLPDNPNRWLVRLPRRLPAGTAIVLAVEGWNSRVATAEWQVP